MNHLKLHVTILILMLFLPLILVNTQVLNAQINIICDEELLEVIKNNTRTMNIQHDLNISTFSPHTKNFEEYDIIISKHPELEKLLHNHFTATVYIKYQLALIISKNSRIINKIPSNAYYAIHTQQELKKLLHALQDHSMILIPSTDSYYTATTIYRLLSKIYVTNVLEIHNLSNLDSLLENTEAPLIIDARQVPYLLNNIENFHIIYIYSSVYQNLIAHKIFIQDHIDPNNVYQQIVQKIINN
ncbi:MAG: hypothetical protein P857_305 [Candidatus Xenolissoclinum pacificiensis L6]|uniref:Uncharacterized protein n=1 Tax=Candidatus Xenolissoclinum pacificiensis L6 TaxID=1401685 RepID=W2UZV3_9RICK|nr:MAG: hypothetical protein P857_305 [Candidatus Xenolissoclinum pacificiensis L6]